MITVRRISTFDTSSFVRGFGSRNGEVMDGRLPPTVARLVKEWTELRREP